MMKQTQFRKSVFALARFTLAITSTGLATSLLHAQALAAKPTPTIATVAGTGAAGLANAGMLNLPQAAAYDAAGNLYIADTTNNQIQRVDAVTGVMTTAAGTGVAGDTGDNGPATSATLNKPYGIAFDTLGNYYIAEFTACLIRQVNPAGVIKTVAGTGTCTATPGISYTVGVTANAVTITAPLGLATDSVGNVYFSSATRLFRVNIPTNLLYVYACKGTNGKNIDSDGLSAANAGCGTPTGVAVDSLGNVYFADNANALVRKITASTGIISEVAGIFDNPPPVTTTPTPILGNTGDGGPATSAPLNKPVGVYVDPGFNVYIASSAANTVRVVNQTTGNISTIAGAANTTAATGTPGATGDGGPSVNALLNSPYGLAGSATGDKIAIVDQKNNEVRVLSIRNSFPSTVTGSSSSAQTVAFQATQAGSATSFGLTAPSAEFKAATPTGCPGTVVAGGVCTDAITFSPLAPGLRAGSLALTDSTGARALLGLTGVGLAPALSFSVGPLTNFAGTGTAGSTGDAGAATSARLSGPSSVVLDGAGNAYIADTANNRLRFVNASTGVISTIAGNGTAGFSGDAAAPTSAQLNAPGGVAVDASGNVYIADTGNNRIRLISASTGLISTVAGGATAGSTGDGGPAIAALLNGPKDVATDAAGNVYIADTGNNEIRKIFFNGGVITTVVGTGTAGTSADGTTATAAAINGPAGVAIGSTGILYLSDAGNSLVRKVVNGVISTIAGNGTQGSTGDDLVATIAQINGPAHLAVDAAGDLYIACVGSHSLREVNSASGIINTIAGTGAAGISTSATISTSSSLSSPQGVAISAASKLYIADTGNNRVALVDETVPTLNFGNVNRAASSASISIQAQNYGNQPLAISAIATTPSTFVRLTGASTDCAAASVLQPGATCQVRITFTPTAGGPATGTVTITDNALNASGSTQTLQLMGTGIVVPAFVTVKTGNNQTVAPLGLFTPFTVLVTDTSGFAANGASITFAVPTTGSTGTFPGGASTVTLTTALDGTATSPVLTAGFTRGTFTATATTPGVATAANFTETIAGNIAPTVTLTIPGGSSATYGQTLMLNVTLAPSSVGGVPATGTVTFFDNGTSIGSSTVSAGAASLSYAPFAGANSFTATYSGDTNFSTASTAASTPIAVAQLGITASATSYTQPYGQKIAAVAGTLTGVLTKDAANVSVTTLPNTSLTFPPVGSYPLVATLSGSAAGNYSATVTGNPTLTIQTASTTTSVVAAPTQVYKGSPIAFTATVVSVVAGAPVPTGTVTFTSGSTSLGTFPLSVTGTATANSSALLPGTNTVTATYNGSVNNLTSNGSASAVVIGPDFTETTDQVALTIPQGARGYVTVTVAANPVFNSTISFSCPGIPSTFSCTFLPPTIASNGSTVVIIGTSGSTAELQPGPRQHSTELFAYIILPCVILLVGMSRKAKRFGTVGIRLGMLVFLLSMGAIVTLSGCGTAVPEPLSPLGVQTINVTSNGGGVTHVVPVAVTISPAVTQ